MVKFEQGLIKITDFKAFSNHATKGKLKEKISPVCCFFFVFFCRVYFFLIVQSKAGLPRSGKKFWKMKVRELHFQSGKFKKNEKSHEKSGNFKIFLKRC